MIYHANSIEQNSFQCLEEPTTYTEIDPSLKDVDKKIHEFSTNLLLTQIKENQVNLFHEVNLLKISSAKMKKKIEKRDRVIIKQQEEINSIRSQIESEDRSKKKTFFRALFRFLSSFKNLLFSLPLLSQLSRNCFHSSERLERASIREQLCKLGSDFTDLLLSTSCIIAYISKVVIKKVFS